MPRVIVFHRGYGCDTGCCGHAIEVDGLELPDSFTFDHPGWREDFRSFAEGMIADFMGREHVADLDWEHSVVTDDC